MTDGEKLLPSKVSLPNGSCTLLLFADAIDGTVETETEQFLLILSIPSDFLCVFDSH